MRLLMAVQLDGVELCGASAESASRNRFASACRSFHAMLLFLSISGRNSQNVSPYQTRSVAAVTVAERGPPSIRASSPKQSPGPRVAWWTPFFETVAFPGLDEKKSGATGTFHDDGASGWRYACGQAGARAPGRSGRDGIDPGPRRR